MQRLRDHGAATVTLVENGVEFDHFARPMPPPPEYATLGPRRVVYSGAIDFRFDGDLVLALARARPDVEFVLIGAGDGLSSRAAAGLANVHRLGTRPYDALPAYLQHASIALLPLNNHPANAGRSPMKFYEYAAAGLPILASRARELERRAEPFVRFVDADHPERALDDVLRDPPRPDPTKVAAHDWTRIAHRVLDLALGVQH
jgi:glycosyltransferase involved in cell wall biosynthesis